MSSVGEQTRDEPVNAAVFARVAGQVFCQSLRLPDRVVARMREPIIALDEQHRITDCNAAAEKFYGFRLAEVVGLPFGVATGCEWPPRSWRGPLSGWHGTVVQRSRHVGAERKLHIEISIVAAAEAGGDPHPSDSHCFLIVHRTPEDEVLSAKLRERDRFDELISDLSAQFAGLLAQDIDAAVNSALLRLCNVLGVERASFAVIREVGSILVTHRFAMPGVMPPKLGVADMRLPWLVSQLRAGRVMALRDVIKEMPPEAVLERQEFGAMKMKSGTSIPVRVGDSVCSVLSFSTYKEFRDWPPHVIDRLRVAAEIFANAVARHKAKERLDRKQQELAHLGRVSAMSELASVIAHELDQPLTAITANAQAARHLLARAEPDIGETYAAIDDIIADCVRATEILQRERRLLRKGEGKFEMVDLNDVVREMEVFIHADARQHGCEMTLELSPDRLSVFADRVQLQQVLLNLTRNAVQAMSDQPRETRVLCVRTACDEKQVTLQVIDAGAPVEVEQLQRMFERFFTTKEAGLGMGLPISRSIVQMHGGELWATRNADRGLTMHVAMPREVEGSHGRS
jgi:signal transduction histidine kinase